METPSSSANARATAAAIARVSFGLSLVCLGLIHYMQFRSFSLVVSDGLGALTIFGMIWSYILPTLYIVGGGLFALNIGMDLAIWLIGIGIGSIAPGMLLKSVMTSIDVTDMMAAANNAFIWMAIFLLIVVLSHSPAMQRMAVVNEAAKKPAPLPAKAPVATKTSNSKVTKK
jgi:hypothetical protein